MSIKDKPLLNYFVNPARTCFWQVVASSLVIILVSILVILFSLTSAIGL